MLINNKSPFVASSWSHTYLLKKHDLGSPNAGVFRCNPVHVVILAKKNIIIIAQIKRNKDKVRPRTDHEGPERE